MENEEKLETTELEEVVEQEESTVVEEKRPILALPEKEEKTTTTIDGVEYPKELIEEARKQGWRDKSFLKGKGMDNKFLDPATFIERGEKAVPFLNKKIEDRDKEIEVMKGMLKKQLAYNVEDAEKKLNKAKEYGEYEEMESLIERKLELKKDLDGYSTPEVPLAPPIQQPIEQTAWETDNTWVFDTKNPYNAKKAMEANRLFKQIGEDRPDLDLATRFRLLDHNLASYDSKIQQKANVTIPVETQSSSRGLPVETKSIANLTTKMKGIFEDSCRDGKGNKFTGNSLEAAKRVFLDSCSDECFKK